MGYGDGWLPKYEGREDLPSTTMRGGLLAETMTPPQTDEFNALSSSGGQASNGARGIQMAAIGALKGPMGQGASTGGSDDFTESRKQAWNIYAKLQMAYPDQYPKAPAAIFFAPMDSNEELHGGATSPLFQPAMFLSDKFGSLSDGNLFDLYWAVAHEGLHRNQPWLDLLRYRNDPDVEAAIDQQARKNAEGIFGFPTEKSNLFP